MSQIQLSLPLVIQQRKRLPQDVYETPELNECLFLHGLGISHVCPKFGEQYINLVQLSLENNMLSMTGNLQKCVNLRLLNLRGNSFTCIHFENDFGTMKSLEELNLDGNKIESFQAPLRNNCSPLNQIRLSRNRLSAMVDFSSFKSIELVDVSHNVISDSPLSEMSDFLPPSIKQVYLSPNPFIQFTKQYRRSVIELVPSLCYLDRGFVTDLERIGNDPLAVQEFHEERRRELNNRALGLYNMNVGGTGADRSCTLNTAENVEE